MPEQGEHAVCDVLTKHRHQSGMAMADLCGSCGTTKTNQRREPVHSLVSLGSQVVEPNAQGPHEQMGGEQVRALEPSGKKETRTFRQPCAESLMMKQHR